MNPLLIFAVVLGLGCIVWEFYQISFEKDKWWDSLILVSGLALVFLLSDLDIWVTSIIIFYFGASIWLWWNIFGGIDISLGKFYNKLSSDKIEEELSKSYVFYKVQKWIIYLHNKILSY